MATSWILLSLLSALFLGLYDLAKKNAVHENAVPAVLLLNVLTAAVVYLPLVLWVHFTLEAPQVTSLSGHEHLLLFLKSALVGASWTSAFMALKHLPLSIASPIRATSPLWTILIAVLLLNERPSLWQWLGVIVVLIAFLFFTSLGRKEGIRFARDRWVGLMCLATLLGSMSALYDKYLLQSCGLQPFTVQAWFSIYLCPVMLPLAAKWYTWDRKQPSFHFRWSIPAIAVCLLIADFLYFSAISEPEALIAVISPARRTSAVIPFTYGILKLKEKNWKPKLACLGFMLLGVLLLSL